MPDYADILDFLAKNPPQMDAERQLHASLLELMAQCLRDDTPTRAESLAPSEEPLESKITDSHIHWVRFN